MSPLNIRVLNNSEDHAKFGFDVGDGKMEVFFNRSDPPERTVGLDKLHVYEMAIGSISGQDDYDIGPNTQAAAEALKQFLRSHKPDMVVFHTAARPGETAAALTDHAKSVKLGGYATYRHVTAGMATFAFVKSKSDADSITAFLAASRDLIIARKFQV